MPLPDPISGRTLTHTRAVRFQGFHRPDGLWDIEGHITDHKMDGDAFLAACVRPLGEPIHDMWVRLTIDESYRIVEACASSDATPYTGYCERIAPEYSRLQGLTLASGFRRKVMELFGGVAGCTHITEMLGQFPTAAFQTLAGHKRDVERREQLRRAAQGESVDSESQADGDGDTQPFQFDRCHTLDTRGEAVARFYPRWAQGNAGSTKR